MVIDEPRELRRRAAAAPVARLATLRPDGVPRLVPVTFALVDELLCFAVDEIKPRRAVRLARLTDIARDPRVALLVDHFTTTRTGRPCGGSASTGARPRTSAPARLPRRRADTVTANAADIIIARTARRASRASVVV